MSDHLLPDDLWQIIGSKLESEGDRVRFRAVCKSWMSLLPTRQPPWLLLPEENPSDPSRRSFICLGDEQRYKINLPELHERHCIGSSGNWLITVHMNKTLTILNPFSKHQIHLPSFPFETVYDDDEEVEDEDITRCEKCKIVLSSSPCNSECIALWFHFQFFALGIARPGDASWTFVQPQSYYSNPFHDVIFYKQQFHVINSQGGLLVCDIGDCQNPFKMTISYLTDWRFEPKQKRKRYLGIKHYLVEWLDELLLVIKLKNLKTESFEVYTFDFVNMKFNELSNLGEHSLFLGFNTSVSVLASDYKFGVRKNCIYFTDDYCYLVFTVGYTADSDMGVFDLEDKSIIPYYKGVSTPFCLAPVWIVPS